MRRCWRRTSSPTRAVTPPVFDRATVTPPVFAIALHEAGHAYDFATFPYKGAYALLRIVPFMDLYQEKYATEQAIDYLIEVGDRDAELHAYRALWPAYGTYAGSYLPVAFGSVVGAGVGHVAGRLNAKTRQRFCQRMDGSSGDASIESSTSAQAK